jgi:hypothetical protein
MDDFKRINHVTVCVAIWMWVMVEHIASPRRGMLKCNAWYKFQLKATRKLVKCLPEIRELSKSSVGKVERKIYLSFF